MVEKSLLENSTVEQLLQILASEYESIFLLDANRDIFKFYRLPDFIKEQYGDFFTETSSYERAIQKLISDSVVDEDLISMLQETSIAGIKQNLLKNKVFIKDFTVEIDNVKKHYRFKATRLDFPKDEYIVVLGVSDVGFQKEKELEQYAYADVTTGGFNYNYFKEHLTNIHERGFLVSMDIHSFKIINKVCGVKVGDIVLKAIYRGLEEVLSHYQFFSLQSRINADHFVFYARTEDKKIIENVLNQITIAMVTLSSKMHTPQIIPYFGITLWSPEKTVEMVYSEANTAKHQIVDSSDSNYEFYNEEVENYLLAQKKMEDSFDEAIRDKEFEIWYQKKCNPHSGLMTGAEALIRWHRKDGSYEAPGKFIPLFERDGMIRRLDEYVFREVCNQQRKWLDKGLQIVPVSVNVSRASLYYWDIVDVYKKIIDDVHIDTKFVPIEITESATVGNTNISEIVKCFSKAGFKLHMDDFGTGYSSLATLNMMHFDSLKLDKSLIDFIGDYSGDRLLEHTISLAKDLGMTVIAEGVEKQEQVEFLNRYECDSIQGFYFAQPQPVKEFEKNLKCFSDESDVEDLPSVYIATSGRNLPNNIYLQAMEALVRTFHKILKVNLTNNTYEIIKFYFLEMDESHGYERTFSKWISSFVESGQIHKEDLDTFLRVLDVKYLRKAFKRKHKKITLRYRRKTFEEFRWVLLEMIPALNYSDENQEIMLYVQDVHDSYMAQLENQKELEKTCNTDTLTGISSLYCYKKTVRNFAMDFSISSVGLIFADLNGLKIMNDAYGHKYGNELICNFAKMISKSFGKKNCFRIAGDEFVILQTNFRREDFFAKAEKFYEGIKKELLPVACLGWDWSSDITALSELLENAEKEMYKEKKLFYAMHPDFCRESVEKNYQQEISAVIRVLSQQFYILAVVDLEKNQYKMYKDILPESQQKDFSTYRDFINFLSKKACDEKSFENFTKFADIKWIQEKLKDEKSYGKNITMKSGTEYTFTLIPCSEENGVATKILFSAVIAANDEPDFGDGTKGQ